MTRTSLTLLSMALALAVGACSKDDEYTADVAPADTTAEVATTTTPPPAEIPAPVTDAPVTEPVAPEPTTMGDAVSAADSRFALLDADRDGTVLAAEHASSNAGMFATMDTNADGRVTAEEMDAAGATVAIDKRMSSADKIKAKL